MPVAFGSVDCTTGGEVRSDLALKDNAAATWREEQEQPSTPQRLELKNNAANGLAWPVTPAEWSLFVCLGWRGIASVYAVHKY